MARSSRIMSKLGYSEEERDKSSKYRSHIGSPFFSSPFITESSTLLHNNKQRTKVLTSGGGVSAAGVLLSHIHWEWKAHAENASKKKEAEPKLMHKANKHDLPHWHPEWFLFFGVWPGNNEAGLTFIICIQRAAWQTREAGTLVECWLSPFWPAPRCPKLWPNKSPPCLAFMLSSWLTRI